MDNVLLKLQWPGEGHYSPGGSTVYHVCKYDHKGGFLVSYDPIGSYGYVPFRPSLIEDILNVVAMKPEYGEIIPTNTEATILSVIVLKAYEHYRY